MWLELYKKIHKIETFSIFFRIFAPSSIRFCLFIAALRQAKSLIYALLGFHFVNRAIIVVLVGSAADSCKRYGLSNKSIFRVESL